MNSLLDLLSKAEYEPLSQTELIDLAGEGTKEARDKMAVSCLRLVVSIAKRFAGPAFELEDLVEEGMIHLLRAVDNWNPARGTALSTTVTIYVRNGLNSFIAENCSYGVRIPSSTQKVVRDLEAGNISEDDIRTSRSHRRFQEILNAKSIMKGIYSLQSENRFGESYTIAAPQVKEKEDEIVDVKSLLHKLSPQQKEIIQMRFGIDCDRRTNRQIAHHFGFSESKVDYVVIAALDILGGKGRCKHCKKRYDKIRSTQMFCTKKCGLAAAHLKRRRRYPLSRKCKTCEKRFEITDPSKCQTIYCSDGCAGNVVACEQCSRDFLRRRKATRFCSMKCVGDYNRQLINQDRLAS